jgi:DNA-binding NtrC family response regulator
MAPSAILVDDTDNPWKDEVATIMGRHGFRVARIQDLALAPYLLMSGGTTALILEGRRLGARDLLVLDKVRRLAPSTAIVVVTLAATEAELNHAFDQGATMFVSWPTAEATFLELLQQLDHGDGQ